MGLAILGRRRFVLVGVADGLSGTRTVHRAWGGSVGK